MNLIKSFTQNIFKKNVTWKTVLLTPYFTRPEKVLDFGCGDLSLSKGLKTAHPFLKITGVDVVDFPKRPKNIAYTTYEGKKLPFKDNSFDTVIAFYVFHHCDDVGASFKECARVARRRVLFVESIYRHPIEIPFMRLMDWIYNVVKPEAVPLSYQFLSYKDWKKVFIKNQMKIKSDKEIQQVFLPRFLPIGISYVFEVVKTK